MRESEAVKILREHHIPYRTTEIDGISALLPKKEVDPHLLRTLGFRISRVIGDQWVVSYKGGRFGLIV